MKMGKKLEYYSTTTNSTYYIHNVYDYIILQN